MAKKGFVAAMEDSEVVIDVVGADEVPAEIERDTAEVAEAAGEVTGDVEVMEEAVEDAVALSDIADTAEDSVEEGEGMDPVAAEIAEVAVESIYARLGISKKASPSMEAFGSTGSRKTATRVAVEDWKESVKKVWEGVKRFFVQIWEKVKELFARFLDLFKNLEKAALSVKTRVSALKGEAKEAKFENKGLAKALGRGKGVASYGSVSSLLKDQTGFMSEISQASEIMANDLAAKIGKITQLMTSPNAEDAAKVMDDMKRADKETKLGEELFNGTTVIMVAKEGKSFVKTEEAKTEGKEVQTLSKTEMAQVCDGVVALAKDIVAAKKVLAAVDKSTKAISKVAGVVASAGSKEKEHEDAIKATKQAASQMTADGAVMLKLSSISISLTAKTGKAALSYVTASMSQYGEPKAAPKAA